MNPRHRRDLRSRLAAVDAYNRAQAARAAAQPVAPAGSPRPGLGDMVKAGLSAIGITEERVSKVLGRPCGCSKRAAKLNELGHKHLGLPPGSTG